jgi:hypothetical protein
MTSLAELSEERIAESNFMQLLEVVRVPDLSKLSPVPSPATRSLNSDRT